MTGFAGDSAPPSVLVVDDEDSIRNVIALVVARSGGRADLAANVAEARAHLAARSYALAILDKNLPDGGGIQLLTAIKSTSPATEVIIVTGYASTESAVDALRAGAFDYIVKPFDIAAISHRVRLALERTRMVDELRLRNAQIDESRQEAKRAHLEAVMRLSLAAEYKDDAASGHIRRISRYAGLLARAVDATEEWTESIVYAAPLHDIGKIGVAETILRKPGPLTPAERTAVQQHVAVGARILEGTTSEVLLLAREVVLTHHEQWDGNGYPNGLRAEAIPLSGRIVAVADAWDAVSTDRVYRRAMAFDDAVAELRAGAGTRYDDTLVTALLDNLDKVRAIMSDST